MLVGHNESEDEAMRIETTTTRPKHLAQHALSCTRCKIKATRLMEQPSHLEKQELLCAIEWCAFQREGRRLHA